MTTQFADLATESKRVYRDFVWRAANGEEVDPQEALSATLSAGRSATNLSVDSVRAEMRIKKEKEFEDQQFYEKIEAAKAERAAATDAKEKANGIAKKAREDWQATYERLDAAERRVSHLTREQKEASDELRAYMTETGCSPNPLDPVNFMLS